MAGNHQRPTVNDTDENGNKVPQPGPEAPAPEAEKLTPKFHGADGSEITFRVKKSMKLGKAMESYAARFERNVDTLRFLFEGTRILRDMSAVDLEMEEGDTIEVHSEQIGGGTAIEAEFL